ncbi:MULTISPECIES: Lrp/AsnC family transcriptional regulator [unclassified Streptomyces]|uniref:Lrp/AsnC family transcriptional regulator n=1 Tax=unclassified Streptomyces TaxID=2593676 RepID=UPI002E311E71|nr:MULTISPECIES: Lrp/AsnC family transcriptional regulator [unclassified Streptomyces]WUC63954.1 Lrp/AsnC family transcriptional regulator [Streptomyces sp. NBC_00539]
MDSAVSAVDDTDRALVHALQLAPRASWERLAPVLGTRPDTLARRWERLTGAGEAWISGLGLRTGTKAPCMAWVEVMCEAGHSPAVGATLVSDPYSLGLEHTTGGRDLLAFVAVPDLHALYRYLSFRVQRIPGVTGTRSSMVTAVHHAPDRWRLDQLTPAQIGSLTGGSRRSSPPAVAPAVTAMTEEDRPLALALAADARRSVASLARECGMSESTVRRRLGRLETGQGLRYSCAMASGSSGWPVAATLWAEVPEYEVAECAAAAMGLRETRTCMSVSGRWNFMITARLRTVEGLSRYTSELSRRLPGMRITDSAVALHVRKSEAQVLDERGRRIRTVTPDIWADLLPPPEGPA